MKGQEFLSEDEELVSGNNWLSGHTCSPHPHPPTPLKIIQWDVHVVAQQEAECKLSIHCIDPQHSGNKEIRWAETTAGGSSTFSKKKKKLENVANSNLY